LGARGSVVGFSIDLILLAALRLLGQIFFYPKFLPVIFLRVKVQPARKAGILNAICEPIAEEVWDPDKDLKLFALIII
jgi:hypothetical protein